MRALTPLALAEFGDAPFRVVASYRIAGTAEAVFAEMGDPSKWFPLMKRCVWITAETGGVGAERDVTLTGFGQFRGRMLVWDVNQRVAFTMVATTSGMVAQLAEDLRITPDGDGVRLDWTMCGRSRGVGRAIQPLLRVTLRQMMNRAAKELGELVRYSVSDRNVS